MSRIGIDATFLALGGKGVSRYLIEFLTELSHNPRSNHYFIFINKKNKMPKLPKTPQFTYISSHVPSSLIWEQILLPLFSRKYRLDVFHTPLDRISILSSCATIMYLFEVPDHRMALNRARARTLYERISENFVKMIFPMSLRKASRIMVSSKSTANDLMNKYKFDFSKIRLVYPSANNAFKPAESAEVKAIRKKLGCPNGYVLHFSSDDPRDNTFVVLSAYAEAMRSLPQQFPLLIPGPVNSSRAALLKECEKLNISSSVKLLGHMEHGPELIQLYQGATVFLDPSLFEGFGFQVAEAMSCGIPLLTSNVTSLPELVGNAAITSDPANVTTFSAALVKILSNEMLRHEMSEKSRKQSLCFSWTQNVTQTLDVYDEVLNVD